MKWSGVSTMYDEDVQTIEAAKHIATARHLLTSLRARAATPIEPELQEAITELEIALSMLTNKCGGML
jgi:hypothetical protein